jgi:hypothetical protein
MTVAGAAIFVLVASQVLIPGIAAQEVETRLTERGGSAEVRVGAVPALRLLFGDGERLEIDGRDLDLPVDQDLHVFDRLDGFGIVDVAISNSVVGPFQVDRLTLVRDDAGPYHLVTVGQTTAADLVDSGLEGLSLPGQGVLDSLLETLFGPSTAALPISLDLQVASDDGRVRVVSGEASVAGLPAGPLAELITSAIVVSI